MSKLIFRVPVGVARRTIGELFDYSTRGVVHRLPFAPLAIGDYELRVVKEGPEGVVEVFVEVYTKP